MKQRILIVQNITREGPGLIDTVLHEHGIPYDLVNLDNNDLFPPLENYTAAIILGGPDSANDTTEKILHELAQIKKMLEAGVPCLGICLGLQLLVKAAGGSVIKSPVKEAGLLDPEGNQFTVSLTNAGMHDPLFAGMKTAFRVFQLHGETVTLIKEMELLAEGEFCRNQVVRIAPKTYGIQCHFELTPEMFDRWNEEDPDLRVLDTEEQRRCFTSFIDDYTRTGKQLIENFLQIAFSL